MGNTLRNSRYVLVETGRKFMDNQGGLYVDTTWAPEEWAAASGVVISAPKAMKGDLYRDVLRNVRDGDKIYFSYSVIFDYIKQPADDTPEYKNLILYGGREYWRVASGEIFAIKNEFGLWSMITDMVLIEPEKSAYRSVLLTRKEETTGIVRGVPDSKYDFSISDRVVFEEKYIQKYSFDGDMYYLVPPRRVLGIEM